MISLRAQWKRHFLNKIHYHYHRRCVTEPAFRGHFGSMCGFQTGLFATIPQYFPHGDYRGLWTASQRSPTPSPAAILSVHGWKYSLVKDLCCRSKAGTRDESTRAPTNADWTRQRRKGCTTCTLSVGPCRMWQDIVLDLDDATTGVHRSMKRVCAQYISTQNITKRRHWCQLLLARLGLLKSVFRAKVRKCTLGQWCFSHEKLWRKMQLTCPQNKRCWVPKDNAKPDAVQAHNDDIQVFAWLQLCVKRLNST